MLQWQSPPMSQHKFLRVFNASGFAIGAALLFVGWAGACGKTSQGANNPSDGSSAGSGGTQTDVAPATGGATATGGLGHDAGPGSGGATGSGGVTNDGGVQVACSEDGGTGFAAAARQCMQDSDCTIQIAQRCCGAAQALGIAKAQTQAYGACFALAPGACVGLGCAVYIGYQTDTGRTTPFQGISTQPIDLVSVRCVGHLCTTDVVSLPDAGQDGASSADSPADVGADGGFVDAARDAGGPSCGNSTCHSGQACVLILPGMVPPCQPLPDGGSCPAGLVQTASCGGGYLPPFSPGCTQPAPTPACVDVPDGCSGLCDCLCHEGGGAGCYAGAGYLTCAMP